MDKANFRMMCKIELKDANGKVVKTRIFRSRSIVGNFMRWLRWWFTMSGSNSYGTAFTMYDQSEVLQTQVQATARAQSVYGYLGSPSANDYVGIIFGTSDTPVQPDDHKLGAHIAQGSGVGQLGYDAQGLGSVTITSTKTGFNITRNATNTNAATLTVKEVGMGLCVADNALAYHYFLVVHDILPTPFDVPQYHTISATYTFEAIV